MPVCRSPQHERFAQELAAQYLLVPQPRYPKLEAYKRAGYAPDRGNANRLAARKEIENRVEELLEEAREYLDIRPIKALVRVDRIADAKVPDYYEDDGRTLKHLKKLSPRLAEAIAEVEYNDDGSVKRLKLHDKNQANFVLLKHLGGIPEEEAQRTEVNIFNALSPEDQRVLADFVEALARGKVGAGAGVAPPLEPAGKGT